MNTKNVKDARERLKMLKRRRAELGWTQRKLAYAAGCTQRTVHNYETGRTRRPVKAVLEAMEDALSAETQRTQKGD
ncbi:MAG: helix-turn-helix transcriptional regulator [Deltaproteobacteria bacterium]|nr:helix-turn-helix transcriptional regulator [Deltaproteobacteria bacterium]